MIACNAKQTKDISISSQAGDWYCHCIQQHLALKDSMYLSWYCYNQLKNNDTFAFVRYFWGANGGDDSLLYRKYYNDYQILRPFMDSCDKLSYPNLEKVQFHINECQNSDLMTQISQVKIIDSMSFLFAYQEDSIKEIENFYPYYKGCLNTAIINIAFPIIDYSFIPPKIPLGTINEKNINIIVDTNRILTFLERQPFFSYQLERKCKAYSSYPIWIINNCDSTIRLGKSGAIYRLFLEEKQNGKWIQVSTLENEPDTPVPPLLLKPHQTMLSKCPFFHKKRLKRLKFKNVYSNEFY